MNKNTFFTFSLLFMLVLVTTVSSSVNVLDVTVIEYATSLSAYDQLTGNSSVVGLIYTPDAIGESGENHSWWSRDGVFLNTSTIVGKINITNNQSNVVVNSINLTLVDTNNITDIYLDNIPAGNYLQYNISTGIAPVDEDNISVYISELRPGDSVVFNFTIKVGATVDPLNFTSYYDSWKMMTGKTMGVGLNVTNSFPTNVLISDLELYSNPGCMPSYNAGGESCFTFSNLGGLDASNATIDSSSGKTVIKWNASSVGGIGTPGTLTSGETAQLTFDVLAPNNLTHTWNDTSDWATWLNMGNWSASFTFNGSMSGLNIYDIDAVVTESFVEVAKRRVNETHWNASLNLTNDAPTAIDYNVTKISIWATQFGEFSNPGDSTKWVANTDLIMSIGGSIAATTANSTWYPNLNLSQGESNLSYSIAFNYSQVPIVWADIEMSILEDAKQIAELGETRSEPDGYLMIEEIYVLIGGYLLKSTKTIGAIEVPTTNNTYQVNVTLENVGVERTPEWITMFDLIPDKFMPLVYGTNAVSGTRDMTINDIINISDENGNMVLLSTNPNTVLGSADSGIINTGIYNGYWGYHLDLAGLNASSNGDGSYDAGSSESEVLISYKITGEDLAHIENAYIVGIDPIRLDGANPSRNVASKLSILDAINLEFVILFISLILSIILLSAGLMVKDKN